MPPTLSSRLAAWLAPWVLRRLDASWALRLLREAVRRLDRDEYIAPPGAPRALVIVEAEGLTADQVEAIMRTALELICDARAVAKPRLTADRTRTALAAALDDAPRPG